MSEHELNTAARDLLAVRAMIAELEAEVEIIRDEDAILMEETTVVAVLTCAAPP